MAIITARTAAGDGLSRGQHMHNRYQRLLLMVIVLLGAAVGVTKQALAQTFTEFPIPTLSSVPFGITTGPDGALWFTESVNPGGKIGRITTSGVITEFPTPSSQPYGITTGPDGALWFTESLGQKIGRITTSGVITEFPLTDGSFPAGITTGPEGALWFTGGPGIGRITTAGVITGFPTARQLLLNNRTRGRSPPGGNACRPYDLGHWRRDRAPMQRGPQATALLLLWRPLGVGQLLAHRRHEQDAPAAQGVGRKRASEQGRVVESVLHGDQKVSMPAPPKVHQRQRGGGPGAPRG
jgi:hypothetical protein